MEVVVLLRQLRQRQDRARLAALEARVAQVEQECEELRVWVAALERRLALLGEMTAAAELRVHVLFHGWQRE